MSRRRATPEPAPEVPEGPRSTRDEILSVVRAIGDELRNLEDIARRLNPEVETTRDVPT